MAMFLVMMAVAGIGFLMKYVLVPGFKRNQIYGKDVELYFLGIDRHQWGSIHLILSFALLLLLFLHIVLHWRMICAIAIRMIPGKTIRACVITIFAIAAFFFGIGPLFISPEIGPGVSHGHQRASGAANIQAAPALENIVDSALEVATNKQTIAESQTPLSKIVRNHPRQDGEIELYGSMTLSEAAKKYNIDVNALADFIHVPHEYVNERLGRLKRSYGFEMNDLRAYISSASH